MASKQGKSQNRHLGRSWRHLSEDRLANQDNVILSTVKQLVESGLEHTHQTKFKRSDMDASKKYTFDLHVPTGKKSKLGIKLTRKLTVDETRLTIRRIDARDLPYSACKRQRAAEESNIDKLYCNLFGPNLCPHCTQVADQAEFTHMQDVAYPKIDINTRYIVAGGKLNKKKTLTGSKGVFISPFNRPVDVKTIEHVVSDEDIHKRLRGKYITPDNILAINYTPH